MMEADSQADDEEYEAKEDADPPVLTKEALRASGGLGPVGSLGKDGRDETAAVGAVVPHALLFDLFVQRELDP